MKRLIRISVLVVVCILMLSNCKKYPDGGLKRFAKKHLIQKWDLVLYEVNGIDSTNLIYTGPNPDFKKGFITISEINKNLLNTVYFTNESHRHNTNFSSDKNLIGFGVGDTTVSKFCNGNECVRKIFSPVYNVFYQWTIQKLTKKELILQLTLTNNYLIKLKAS